MKKQLALFLMMTIALLVLTSESKSQDTLSRWVFGSGGTLYLSNGDTQINSILGQTAIYTLTPSGGGEVLHQGFWVTDTLTGVDVDDKPISLSPDLMNYPNPFNYNTTIRYILPGSGYATIRIYDMVGRLRKSIALGLQGTGPQEVVWDGKDGEGTDCASGSYMYELSVNSYQSYGSSSQKDFNLRNVMVIVR
ncbi:MAG: FlgD immunoglobulin-like domain containing protein [bacterium]